MNKNAFTMIELIFVIVILGILAAVAIPKLAATRDDAHNATDCSNISRCVMDMGAEYTATATMTPATSQACSSALVSTQNTIAFVLSTSATGTTDDTVTVTGAPGMCTRLNTASVFGGSDVSF